MTSAMKCGLALIASLAVAATVAGALQTSPAPDHSAYCKALAAAHGQATQTFASMCHD